MKKLVFVYQTCSFFYSIRSLVSESRFNFEQLVQNTCGQLEPLVDLDSTKLDSTKLDWTKIERMNE